MSRSYPRSGISAVLGTAIALVIVFTILVPLIIYSQSLQTLFMQEASRRLQYELERLREALEVHVALGPNVEDSGLPAYLIIKNPGTLSVSIPTIYIESSTQGVRQYDVSILVVPGQTIVYRLPRTVPINPPATMRVKVVTLRGNSFYSEEVNPQKPPYMLLVIVGNMSLGCSYDVEVSVSGAYGCVAPSLNQGEICSSTATYTLIGQELGGEGIAGFMVSPGNYSISLTASCQLDGHCGDIGSEGYIVEVLDHTVVDFTLREACLPEKLPIRVSLPAGNITIIGEGRVKIPFTIQLGNLSEPINNVNVGIQVLSHPGLSGADPIQENKIISRLAPGESHTSEFEISIQDDSDPGGLVRYEIDILEAQGEFTGREYSSSDMVQPSIQGEILVCGIKEVDEGAGETTRYVVC